MIARVALSVPFPARCHHQNSATLCPNETESNQCPINNYVTCTNGWPTQTGSGTSEIPAQIAMRRSCSAGCLDISDYDRLGLGQGAPGVRCAVGITGMQDDRVRQRRPRGGDAVEHHDHGSRHRYRRAARRTTRAIAEDTFYVGNLKGVGRVYQQTFIDTYAVARPLPSQAPGAARRQ